MNKKRFIISIIFVIFEIQNNIIGNGTSLDISVIENNSIENTIKDENNNINFNNNITLPTTIDPKEYHKKIQYNPLLSNGKYFLINLINGFNLFISFFFIYMKTIENRLRIIDYEKNIHVIIEISSLITILIFLYDFNKYKKAKNSNDINQYNKYIIDDSNIDQLTKQRRYNFINGFSIVISCIHRILSFISIGLSLKFNISENKNWYGLLYKEATKDKILLSIHIIGELLIFILSIYYLILLIKDNTNTIWNSIKNSFKIKDIFLLIGFLILSFIIFGIIIN